MSGVAGFKGKLTTKVIRVARPGILAQWHRRLANALHALQGAGVFYSQLSARHYIAAEDRWVDLGVICRRLVTNAYVDLLVDELKASVAAHSTFKYHASGTDDGTILPVAVTNIALGAEVQTPRPGAGSQIEGASSYIYKSVETITYTGGYGIREHGLFNAATGPTLMDRHTFGVITVVATDQIQFTYELTCQSGG